MRIFFPISFCLFFVIALTGCDDSDDNDGSIPSGDSDLKVELVLRDVFNNESDSFVQGETIEFLLTVTNDTNSAVTLNFSNGQQYDFYVTTRAGEEIWRWSDGTAFTEALTSRDIEAQSAITISQDWNQVTADSSLIEIGEYTAHGSMLDETEEAKYDFSIQ